MALLPGRIRCGPYKSNGMGCCASHALSLPSPLLTKEGNDGAPSPLPILRLRSGQAKGEKEKTLDPLLDWIPDYKRRGQASRMTEGGRRGGQRGGLLFLSFVCCFHLTNRPICEVGVRGASRVIRCMLGHSGMAPCRSRTPLRPFVAPNRYRGAERPAWQVGRTNQQPTTHRGGGHDQTRGRD